MGRRRRGKKIDGWIVLDKPLGLSSTAALGAVKRLLHPQKAGHGGTLDPLATGVLPIALGEATKTMPFIVDSTKEYEFQVCWGEERNTDDREGEVTHTSDHRPDARQIDAALGGFIGEIEQIPPAFSAIKVDGTRAYDLARAGKPPEMRARTVRVERLERLVGGEKHSDAEHTSFHLVCGKGTYVRALARDLARVLGTRGHVSALRRTRVGPFQISHAISLELLNDLSHSARAEESILPVMTALADIPALAVTENEADRIRHGQAVNLPTARSGTICLTHGGMPLAVAEASEGIVRPLRVFNLA
ncbi:MAG: tRNA pseudouridine(55) synthase TruB [Proteobacteria bacterium]|nr:tRNA pseudouridine(55) synthase TruB [Pseudomonadota bacterium]